TDKVNIFGTELRTRGLKGRVWWRMPLIPALRRQTQADLREFQDRQCYTMRPCLKIKKMEGKFKRTPLEGRQP
ncbi:hypothetical protein ACQP3F_31125, partial [Escherichia coli]